jgi:hypothetical protein
MTYQAMQEIYLPLRLYLDIEMYLMETRSHVKTQDYVVDHLKRWLELEQERLAIKTHGHALTGFQWKSVFLPDGTNLRTEHLERIEFAKVVGHHIKSGNHLVSPSQFANQGGGGRNAWRCVWLRFPGEGQWERAADCRARLKRQAQAI